MNVLNLFNGIGIGSLALKNLGVKINKNYISEIDKFANETNSKNHPDSIQLGDILNWREWDINWSDIDLVTAGYPCQPWSVAGQQMGDRDPRGALFWVTLDVISHVMKHNPKAKWFMENVKMKRDFEEYITYHLNRELCFTSKTLINSSLLTSQNRNRYYWSNFKIVQPKDMGLNIYDVVEDSINGITSEDFNGGNLAIPIEDLRDYDIYFGAMRGRYIKGQSGKTEQRVEIRLDKKSNTLTTVQKDNIIVYVKDLDKKSFLPSEVNYRKLMISEAERLQGYPIGYTEGVSTTQRFKQIGNGWTLPVIEHIFKCMLEEK